MNETIKVTELKALSNSSKTNILDIIDIYKIKNSLLSPNGLILTEDFIPIKDSIIRDWQIKILFNDLKLQYGSLNTNLNITNLNGEYISLVAPWDFTFWHWIVEHLTKVALAEHFGFKGKYIVSPRNNFMLESLELIGINKDRLLIYDKRSFLKLEYLYLNENIKLYSGKEILFYLEQLRKSILKKVDKKNSKKRIYISRKKSANNRKIINELEIVELLKNYGFESHIMEQYSFREQVELVSNCECLIGGNGSGMTHALFMLPKSLVIEFFSPNYTTTALFPIIDLLKHDYYMLTSPTNGIYQYGQSIDSDIYVPIELLKINLENYFKDK